jgi:AcrR family transcriptional regulator
MPYDEVSINDIADEAGVAHGLLYYHFRDKQGIYLAALTKVTSDIIELHRPDDDEGSSPADKLRGLLRRQIAYRQSHSQTVLAMIRAGDHDPHVNALLQQARKPGAQFVLELLGARTPPSAALRTAIRGSMGFLDEMTADWIAHGRDLAPAELEELGFKAIVAALSAVHVDDPTVNAALLDLQNYRFTEPTSVRTPRKRSGRSASRSARPRSHDRRPGDG